MIELACSSNKVKEFLDRFNEKIASRKSALILRMSLKQAVTLDQLCATGYSVLPNLHKITALVFQIDNKRQITIECSILCFVYLKGVVLAKVKLLK